MQTSFSHKVGLRTLFAITAVVANTLCYSADNGCKFLVKNHVYSRFQAANSKIFKGKCNLHCLHKCFTCWIRSAKHWCQVYSDASHACITDISLCLQTRKLIWQITIYYKTRSQWICTNVTDVNFAFLTSRYAVSWGWSHSHETKNLPCFHKRNLATILSTPSPGASALGLSILLTFCQGLQSVCRTVVGLCPSLPCLP